MECGFSGRKDTYGLFRLGAPSEIAYPEGGSDLMMEVENSSFWFAHRARVLSSLMQRLPPTGVVLDVGGGNGYQTLRLQSEGRNSSLVEPGAAGCQNAIRRGVRRVINARLEDLCLNNGVAGAVLLLDVIEHLENPQPLLVEARRILRPGGLLFITVPALEILWSDEDLYAQHFRRYTRDDLKGTLLEAGFAVNFLTFFFQPILFPILLLRAMPYRLGLRNRTTPDKSEHQTRGLAGRVIDRWLKSEHDSLSRGGTLQYGSSLVAIATPRVF